MRSGVRISGTFKDRLVFDAAVSTLKGQHWRSTSRTHAIDVPLFESLQKFIEGYLHHVAQPIVQQYAADGEDKPQTD